MNTPKSSAPARTSEDPAPRLPDHELIRLDAAAPSPLQARITPAQKWFDCNPYVLVL
jgi:hypothetical protein